MKRLSFLLIAAFAFSGAFAQVCTVLDTFTQPGLYPDDDDLPCVVRDSCYDVTFFFKNFDQVTFGGTTVTLDSVRIDSVLNIPCGLGLASNPADFVYAGGEAGCLRVVGKTSDVAGEYPLIIWVTAWIDGIGEVSPLNANDQLGLDFIVRVSNSASDPCPPLDTLPANDQTSTCMTSYNDALAQCPVGINDLSREISDFNVVPNPMNENAAVTFTTDENSVYNFRVFDVLGNIVHEQKVNAVVGRNQIDFSRNGLSGGIYFFSLTEGKAAITKRLVISE